MTTASKSRLKALPQSASTAWSVRELRSAEVSRFLEERVGQVQLVENQKAHTRGYLAGGEVFQEVYERAVRTQRALYTRTNNVDEAMKAFAEELAEILESIGASVERRDPTETALPKTAHGELDFVALSRTIVPADSAPMKPLPRGAAPRFRLKDESEVSAV